MSNRYPMYPTRKINYSKSNHPIIKYKDYMGVFCPVCFNPIVMRTSITLNMQHVDKDEEAEIRVTQQYMIECPKCHTKNVYSKLDGPNITPMLAELNRKGYETVGSCEGHRLNQKDAELPYIKFKYPRQRDVIKYIPLQGPWFLDETDFPEFIIRCPDVSVPIRERMAHLRRWVNALPYCFEEEFSQDMFTEETQQALAYKALNTPLAPEDITSKEELEAFYDEDDDTRTVTDEHQAHGKKMYSSKEEIKHRNDPDWEPEQKHLNPNKIPRQPSYGSRGYGGYTTTYNPKPKYNSGNKSNNGKGYKKNNKYKGPKNPSGKVSTYTNKQKKNKPVWNPETGKQEYK